MRAAAAFGLSLVLGAAVSAQSPVPRLQDLAGAVAPAVVREVKPSYTAETLQAGVEGIVKLECVVNADGTVSSVRVAESLDPQLDAEAVKAMERWLFRPATKDGVATAVRVEVEMSFTLSDRGPRLDSPGVFMPGAVGVELPRALSEVKPEYPPAMQSAGVRGAVELEAVVLPDGRVGSVRVKKSLDPVLDRAAMRALRRWTFDPGKKDGKAVPVQVVVTMTFELK